MISKIKSIIEKWLFAFLELQLVITTMSLPILICWGLPISYMSLISNMIFTPLLILFLWIASVFSLCALIGIPCYYLVVLMDWTTTSWYYLLSFANPCYLIGFPLHFLPIAILFCLLIFIMYTYIKPTTKKSVFILSLFLFFMIFASHLMQKNICQQVGSLPLTIMRANGKAYLIDNGALCSKENFYNQIDYVIIPELIKASGITTIDTIVLHKPSKKLARAALQLASQANIKTIIITTKLNCYKEATELCKGSGIEVLPLAAKKLQPKARAFLT